MSNLSTSVNATFRQLDNLFFVKKLEVELDEYSIHANLIHLDDNTTNCSYEVWVARKIVNGERNCIVRDWVIRGAHAPWGKKGEPMTFLSHRAQYGGTNWIMGSPAQHDAASNLICAIFDNLLGCCDTEDENVLKDYVRAAEAMYRARLVGSIGNRYNCAVMAPNENINAKRAWDYRDGKFVYIGTTWTLTIDMFNRVSFRDLEMTTTYEVARDQLRKNLITAKDLLA
ncbi:hypothetical protein ACSA002_1690 [Salmonella phage vB_SalM_SA002]|nr:hypothetical protein ACSA002_1690 [Salmonella phage vB_SalM_SA002]